MPGHLDGVLPRQLDRILDEGLPRHRDGLLSGHLFRPGWAGHLDGISPGLLDGVSPEHLGGVLPGHLEARYGNGFLCSRQKMGMNSCVAGKEWE